MKDLRVVFMGTPEFAVPSLQIMVENQVSVVGVITAPDKPQGRGKKLGQSAVKEYALSADLKILQPEKLKNEDFLNELKSLQADLQVVVAFRMLPEVVWNMPPLGTFNLHASLLPQYRGAAPINWAIINGEKETGVTTFFLKHQIDTGDIIFQEKEPINYTDNVGDLYRRLMDKGAHLVLKTVKAIASDGYEERPQQASSELRPAPKIFRDTCEINWNRTGNEIYNFVRGLSPYPAAWTRLDGKVLKVYKATVEEYDHAEAGAVRSDNKTYLKFGCADGWVHLLEIQLEGKKRMNVEDFLKGYKL
ncbi:MAG: methionyl-tRNA formyltransferase [Cyclobacteriaceae bacterium]